MDHFELESKKDVIHYMRTTNCADVGGTFGVTPGTDQVESTDTDISDLPHVYNPAVPTSEPSTGKY